MTIQFYPKNKMVRIGEKFFPAKPFPGMNEAQHVGICMGFTIPLGESGKELSCTFGVGTYSDNRMLQYPTPIDPSMEINEIEVGYDFGGERDFDVTGWVNSDELSRMIIRAMSGEDPF